ncbi:Tyrosine recombinase XerC [Paraburkholderia nemoris]|uniref:tyrosine-type recombinase/integrase n=1 Tax=Paraburkholderia nemoris TaxID=2793076 RepID=UPI00190A5F28|nr:site-specific integrase [Paraburkholderia nemoris]MBK3743158.1 site-specific integrase [Paraburkholderia aspalathi]CAE6768842.1 Tyrosine recombinase XerC [Paraburkholderia nemoris]
MATIRERRDAQGKKSYHVQIRLKGFPPQTKSFDSKTIAKQWAAHVEAELRAGRYMQRVEAERHTVGELLEKYRNEVLTPHKPERVRDQGLILNWWESKLGVYSLAELSPALIGACRDELAATPVGKDKPRAPATVVRYLATLSHVLSVAVKEWQWLEESPMPKVSKPRVSNERVRHLTDEERKRLIKAAGESANTYLHAIVIIAISTGMRYGELMNLRWRDITLAEADRYALIVLERTKNGERRGLPVTGAALKEIRRLRAQYVRTHQGRTNLNALLFASESDPDKPVQIRKAWDTTLKRARIENFRFHDLRHTTASYLAMGGATAPEIAEILGHKDLKMVKRYAHFGKDHIAKVLTRMSEARFGTDIELESAQPLPDAT